MLNKHLPDFIRSYKDRFAKIIAAGFIVLANLAYLFFPALVHAEDHAWAALRLDRMQTSQTTGGTVMLRTGSTGSETEASVQVTFPGSGTQGAASFGVNSTFGNWTVTTTNLPAGCGAWTGINTATAVSGATVTFPSGNLAASTTYCFNFSGTNTLSTPTSNNSDLNGTIVTRTSTPTVIDTTTYATASVGGDQVTVSATVPATFNFALSGSTDNLGNLTTSSVNSSPTPRTVTIGTNASSGYIVWVKDTNAGLTSSTASDTIDTSGTVDDACSAAYSAGSEFYGLDADETSDPQTNGSIDLEYNCTSTTVGAYSTTYTEVATGSGATSGYVLTLNNRAAAGSLNKPATDYSDIVTLTGAGQF